MAMSLKLELLFQTCSFLFDPLFTFCGCVLGFRNAPFSTVVWLLKAMLTCQKNVISWRLSTWIRFQEFFDWFISDAATIAQWKDALNDAWADLGELIDTRTQMLEASKELHKYFHDCKDVLGRILEKENSMSEELGRDSGSVSALLRKHQNFLQDLQGTYRHWY